MDDEDVKLLFDFCFESHYMTEFNRLQNAVSLVLMFLLAACILSITKFIFSV